MKRNLCLIFFVALLMISTTYSEEKVIDVNMGTVLVKVDGKQIDNQTILYNSSTYAPLREISEALGLKVEWLGNINTVVISKNEEIQTKSNYQSEDYIKGYQNISVKLNSINLIVNGNKVEKENILYNGLTYVPLRALVELLDAEIYWDGENSIVNIYLIDENEIVAEEKEEVEEKEEKKEKKLAKPKYGDMLKIPEGATREDVESFNKDDIKEISHKDLKLEKLDIEIGIAGRGGPDDDGYVIAQFVNRHDFPIKGIVLEIEPDESYYRKILPYKAIDNFLIAISVAHRDNHTAYIPLINDKDFSKKGISEEDDTKKIDIYYFKSGGRSEKEEEKSEHYDKGFNSNEISNIYRSIGDIEVNIEEYEIYIKSVIIIGYGKDGKLIGREYIYNKEKGKLVPFYSYDEE